MPWWVCYNFHASSPSYAIIQWDGRCCGIVWGSHNVRVLYRCLSLLGLCLIQFHSPIGRQAMVNLSPHHIDEERVITVMEHDRGIHLRNCIFTRMCWVMFLAFPLDFQTCEIITQAVGYFGSVVTCTNNASCKSRMLLRCKVTLISRIPCSLLICEGSPAGHNGSSWTVVVFVLNSNLNDVMPGDEDQIPPMAIPILKMLSISTWITSLAFFKMWVTWIMFIKRMWIMDGRLLPNLMMRWVGFLGCNRLRKMLETMKLLVSITLLML